MIAEVENEVKQIRRGNLYPQPASFRSTNTTQTQDIWTDEQIGEEVYIWAEHLVPD